MANTARVPAADLEAALDYLEGLVVILRKFDTGEEGHDPRAQLAVALMSMDSHGQGWEPLRYQSATGLGWQYLADNVDTLRERLLGPYTEAAL